MREESIDLKHKDLLHDRFKKLALPISELSFANLYLFRKIHETKVVFDDKIFIKGKTRDGKTYLLPTVDVRSLNHDYLVKMARDVDFFFPIPEEWLSHFNDQQFEKINKECDSDYVYTIEKMATFAGRKLHKKRNLLKQFVEGYKHEALPLTNERLKDAINILDEWQNSTGVGAEATDYESCREAIEKGEELVICGGIFYADNEPAGFILGEDLNNEMFVFHFAKGKTKFKGLYQYMYNAFAGIMPKSYKYLNLEQDMCNDSIRISKSSYVPDLMVKKYRVSLKK